MEERMDMKPQKPVREGGRLLVCGLGRGVEWTRVDG